MTELVARKALWPLWRADSMARLLPLGVVVAALVTSVVLVELSGADLGTAGSAFWNGIAGSDYALVGSINRAIPLSLVGLGFIVAQRANLTNVGGEGQICVGGIFSTAAAVHWGAGSLPFGLSFAYPLLAGCLAGAVWGGLVGILKAKRGSDEVITSLLLSFIGLQMVYGAVQSEALLRKPRSDSATLPESAELPFATRLPALTDGLELPLHIGVGIVAIVAVVIAVVMRYSTLGLRLLAIGQNQLASKRAGLSVGLHLAGALAVSGALGGLAGAIMVQGEQHYLTAGFSSGYGFDGLVVGLLARGSAFSVASFALLFGCLRSGGMAMEISASVPAAVVLVAQGVIVVATAGAAAMLRRHT